MIASHAQKTCVQARTPPSGGGPGSTIDRVVNREATLPMALLVADFDFESGCPSAPDELGAFGVGNGCKTSSFSIVISCILRL